MAFNHEKSTMYKMITYGIYHKNSATTVSSLYLFMHINIQLCIL